VAAFVFASITVWYMLGENFIDRREKRRGEKKKREMFSLMIYFCTFII
jgi:hypothetical protein